MPIGAAPLSVAVVAEAAPPEVAVACVWVNGVALTATSLPTDCPDSAADTRDEISVADSLDEKSNVEYPGIGVGNTGSTSPGSE